MPVAALESMLSLDDDSVRGYLTGIAAASALSDLAEGINRLALKDPAGAEAACERLWALSPASSTVRAILRAAHANVMCYAARPAEAIELLAEASSLAVSTNDPGAVARVHHASIQPFARLGRLADAHRAAGLALEAYLTEGDTDRAARVRMNMGILARMQGKPEEALECFEASRAALESDAMACGALESNRAEALLDLARFADAHAAFELALERFERSGNSHAAAIVEGNLADLLARQGRVDAALARFEHARCAFERSGAAGETARLAIEEGEFLCSVGAAREAAAAFRAALPSLASAGLRREFARATLAYGRLALAHDETASALDLLGQSERAWGEIGDASSRAEAALLHSLASGSIDRATIEPLLTLISTRGTRLASVLLDITARAAHLERWRDLGRWLETARPTVEALGLRPLSFRLELAAGQLALANVDPASALAHFQSAVRHAEFLQASFPAGHIVSGLSRTWDLAYEGAVRAALDVDPRRELQTAFHTLELQHARSLRVAMPVAESDDDPLAARYEAAAAELRATYLLLSEPRPSAILNRDRLRDLVLELEGQVDALRNRLSARSSSRPVLRDPPKLESIPASLAADQAIVCYFTDGPSLGAILITPAGVSVRRELASRAGIADTVRKLQFEASRRPIGRTDAHLLPTKLKLLQRLAAALWAPLQAALGPYSVIGVVPSIELANVPWAALRLDERPLVSRWRVVVLPSVTAGLAARGSPSDSPRVLSVAVSDAAAPAASIESRAIEASIPNATILRDGDATAGNALAAMPGCDIVHLACHGVHSSAFPLSSRLKLADRWVTGRELAGHLKPGAVVVLSACESARAGDDSAAALPAIARVSLAGGASAVIASRWAIGDQFAAKWFPPLIQRLSRGELPSGALRAIQLECVSSHESSFDWGGLVVIGALQ